jgi:hypothetical protein
MKFHSSDCGGLKKFAASVYLYLQCMGGCAGDFLLQL